MMTDHRFDSLQTLRLYIHHTLCQQEHLETDAFPLTERVLVRGGRPCGIFYCLHGPRSVKITAIWDAARNVVFFYGSSGERVLTNRLDTGPRLVPAA
ncbi:MAG: hypothetical protein U0795_24680 [Pirellulales bacterium]